MCIDIKRTRSKLGQIQGVLHGPSSESALHKQEEQVAIFLAKFNEELAKKNFSKQSNQVAFLKLVCELSKKDQAHQSLGQD